MLRDVKEGGGKYDDAKEKMKNFPFYLCIVDLDTIMGFFR